MRPLLPSPIYHPLIPLRTWMSRSLFRLSKRQNAWTTVGKSDAPDKDHLNPLPAPSREPNAVCIKGINSNAPPRFVRGLGMSAFLTRLECERERDERGVHIPRMQRRLEQTLESARRAVRFWKARKS